MSTDPENPPAPLTEDRVTEIVTSVVKEALQTLQPPKTPEIDVAAIAAEVAKLVKPEPEKTGDTKDTAESEQVLAMRRKLEEMEQRSQEAEQKARIQARNEAIRQALTAQGVDAARMDVALNHLTASGAIVEQDDGSWAMNGVDRFDQPTRVTIADGVKDFIGSDTGKMFLPPKPVKGTGSRAGNPESVHGSGDLTPHDVANIAMNRLLGGDFSG